MFLRRRPSPDLVLILLQKNNLICAAIAKGSHKPYILKHISEISLPHLATTGSLLHTTLLGSHIAAFTRKYQLTKNCISIVCDDPIIQDGFATTTTASAENYLHANLATPHSSLNSIYLGSYKDAFLHWWHRISYPLILQLHLIAYKHRLNLVRIMPSFPLILETYKKIRGTTFHPVQLITDLERTNFALVNACDSSLLNSFLYYDTHTLSSAHTYIPTLIGAALYEGF